MHIGFFVTCECVALAEFVQFLRIAYAFSDRTETIDSIDTWPAIGTNIFQPKVPTVMRYDPDSPDDFKWGYQIDQFLDEDVIKSIKLLFDPYQERPYNVWSHMKSQHEALSRDERTIKVASDYMKAIIEHARRQIIESEGHANALDNYRIEYMITVPAVWSDRAKDMTLKV